jgi:RNA polymerase sigma-70 factor (ECF subfamily)
VTRRYCSQAYRDPEDLVQEVFLHLFKALKEYDPARPLDPFVLEIARNVCISSLRHDAAEKRGGRNPGHLSIDARDAVDKKGALVLPSDADDAETALMKAQEVRLVRTALSLLSDACRKLLELRYEGGLSYAEMTERTNVREGTLRVQVLRCLSALGREYGRLIDDREVRQ